MVYSSILTIYSVGVIKMLNFFSLLLQKLPIISLIILTSVIIIPKLGLAEKLPPQVLKSVVSLLPEWPGSRINSKEPEATAVAILPGGYLATNDHVINQAQLIRVRLNDGRVFKSKIIGRDFLTDLALLKIPLDLPVIPLGDTPLLGERVCAIGNQFGLGLSVTCGVTSALHRTGTGFNPIEDFIQTDAVVNPGGSGGALIDSRGNLVGLVSAIFTKDNDANIGVNFAASTDLVMRVVREIKEKGRVIRGNPGFKVRDLSVNERHTYVGVFVTQVSPKGPADIANFKVGDIIVKINKRKIIKSSDIPSVLHMVRPGISLNINFLREGKNRTSTLIIGR
jgi:S1-C subfamily serine protease